MAYFPNGTAGMKFIAQNCDTCSQWKERDKYPGNGEGCPVWDAHVLATRPLHGDEEFATLMRLLIDDSDKESAPVCHMRQPISQALENERAGQERLPI